MAFNKGDLIRTTAVFKDSAGTEIDPTTVAVTHKSPSGTSTTWTHGTDIEVVNDSVGNYHADIDITETGVWTVKWQSTGSGQSVEESQFLVQSALI